MGSKIYLENDEVVDFIMRILERPRQEIEHALDSFLRLENVDASGRKLPGQPLTAEVLPPDGQSISQKGPAVVLRKRGHRPWKVFVKDHYDRRHCETRPIVTLCRLSQSQSMSAREQMDARIKLIEFRVKMRKAASQPKSSELQSGIVSKEDSKKRSIGN